MFIFALNLPIAHANSGSNSTLQIKIARALRSCSDPDMLLHQGYKRNFQNQKDKNLKIVNQKAKKFIHHYMEVVVVSNSIL